jgi:hypothetical protein
MATYTSYEVIGAKEDVSDVITQISPTKTPFQSMIGSEKVSQKYFQWQEDELRAAAANAKVEGADASAITADPTTMRTNYTQILSETIQVADGVDVTDKYGRAKETAYQLAKTASQLKRDLEHTFVGVLTSASAGNASTARYMASYVAQCDSGTKNPLGATTALSETAVTDLQKELFDNGSDPSVLMITPANALIVAGFAGKVTNVTNVAGTENVAAVAARSRSLSGETTTVVNNVERYKSPYGTLNIVVNRFLRAKDSLMFEPDMWKKMVFRPWTRTTLAKTGDSTKIQMLGEFSLKHRNFKASGVIRDNDADMNP